MQTITNLITITLLYILTNKRAAALQKVQTKNITTTLTFICIIVACEILWPAACNSYYFVFKVSAKRRHRVRVRIKHMCVCVYVSELESTTDTPNV